MSELVVARGGQHPAVVPFTGARVPVSVRLATRGDVPFIDALQKKHSGALGFMNFATLEGKIAAGHVLVAEGAGEERSEDGSQRPEVGVRTSEVRVTSDIRSLTSGSAAPRRLGYVIGNDKYLGREELGVVYQMAVLPEARRMLVAATLLKALFERSAYGCRLYCCWCAQDLEGASRFWEGMGFVPIAFRTGSRKGKQSRVPGPGSRGGSEDLGRGTRDSGLRGPRGPRIHIFWQKRIREGDTGAGWWFPSETRGGALGEARIVLPIPPGTRWWEAMPTVLPGMEAGAGCGVLGAGEGESVVTRQAAAGARTPRVRKAKRAEEAAKGREGGVGVSLGGFSFGAAKVEEEKKARPTKAKPPRPRPRMKNDAGQVAMARELRDRYLEEANTPGTGVALALEAAGATPGRRYDVTRGIEARGAAMQVAAMPVLEVIEGDAREVLRAA